MIASEWYTYKTDDEKTAKPFAYTYLLIEYHLDSREEKKNSAKRIKQNEKEKTKNEKEKKKHDALMKRVIFYGSWCVLRGVVPVEIALWQCQLKPKNSTLIRTLHIRKVDYGCDKVCCCAQGMLALVNRTLFWIGRVCVLKCDMLHCATWCWARVM